MAKDFAKMMVQRPKKIAFMRALFGFLAVAALAVKIIILVVNKNMDMIFLYNNITQELLETVLNVMLAVFGAAFAITFFDNKLIMALLIVVGIGLSGLFVFRYMFYYGAPKCFYFTAPDQVGEIIASEESSGDDGSVTFYKRVSDIWVKEIGEITTDGFRPFTDGKVKCMWVNNISATFTYNADESGKISRISLSLQ